jgi:segregation and condensation protein A
MSDDIPASGDHQGVNPAPAAAVDELILAPGAAEDDVRHDPIDGPVSAIDPTDAYAPELAPPPQETGGIEILIQMAAKGEIDPKNIDIIDVTDRFLKAISAAPKENLRQSGKIIFQASVLLRMKAEALLAAKVEDELGYGDDYVDFDIDGSPIIYDSNHQIVGRQITLQDLERALVRQTKVRQLRHKRVTLEQLIEALREAERLEQSRGDRKIKARIAIDGYSDMRDMDDLLELAHDEDIEDVITRIERLLTSLLEANELLSLLHIIEALGGRGDWVDAFLAVLFLSNAGKISLQQEQFYGPLFIVRAEANGNPIVIPPMVPDAGPPLMH